MRKSYEKMFLNFKMDNNDNNNNDYNHHNVHTNLESQRGILGYKTLY